MSYNVLAPPTERERSAVQDDDTPAPLHPVITPSVRGGGGGRASSDFGAYFDGKVRKLRESVAAKQLVEQSACGSASNIFGKVSVSLGR